MAKQKTRVAMVTGDVVYDYHLYGGDKQSLVSMKAPATAYHGHLGGSALTHKLLQSTLAAHNKAKGTLANPYRCVHGLRVIGDKKKLPPNLRSYGVWTPHPKAAEAKGMVWRVQQDFGYGGEPSQVDKADPATSAGQEKPQHFSMLQPTAVAEAPAMVVIDEGGIRFRHEDSRELWPLDQVKQAQCTLVKLVKPLGQGELLTALLNANGGKGLIVLVAARDMRLCDSQIRQHLSWEETAIDAFLVVKRDPFFAELRQAEHLVITFGSAGALWIRGAAEEKDATLIYEPSRLEGDYERKFQGSVYGFQTCMTAAITHHLMLALSIGGKQLSKEWELRLKQGIASGLSAKRELLLLGHGDVKAKLPGFPVKEIGELIAAPRGGCTDVVLPRNPPEGYTILSSVTHHEEGDADHPLKRLAHLAAQHGLGALAHLPCLKLGKFFSVDRREIESLRTLEQLVRTYEAKKVQKKPLSIGVFGPPGAGKSFSVVELAKAIIGEDVKLLEFNLSQFKLPDDLNGALHRVRDAVLEGTTPVAFWDEFDSRNLEWLQYLLAPMQDGAFQEGQIRHPIGKCIFVFAGGTCDTLEAFAGSGGAGAQATEEKLQAFKDVKGPDFVSRLHGYLNISGPNPRDKDPSDITWPIRRALQIRGMLRLGDDEVLDVDPGLLHALLTTTNYKHGSRSLEKILQAIVQDAAGGRLTRSSLPPDSLLGRELNVKELYTLMDEQPKYCQIPPFTTQETETLARAIHAVYGYHARQGNGKPSLQQWVVSKEVTNDYDQLHADKQDANRGAAARIPEHLARLGFRIERAAEGDDTAWKSKLSDAILKHLHLLRLAEHIGWCRERVSQGWKYAEKRDDDDKKHPCLKYWGELSLQDQDKDTTAMRSIPDVLESAGFKAVLVSLAAIENREKDLRK